MTNIFHILQHLAITLDSNYITSIIPFERLKEVFSIFKNYGYEQFHESAVNMIKVGLLRRISKGGELSSKQTFNTSVVIDVSNEEHSEIVQIFASALTLMNRKLLKMEHKNEEPKLINKAFKNASLLMFLQIFAKIMTMGLNFFVARFVQKEVYGYSNI